MALEMGYVCSCGETWTLDEWATVEAHLEANTSHVVSEGYYHDTGTLVADQVPVRASDGTIYRVSVDTAGGVTSWGESGIIAQLPKTNLEATTDPGSSDGSGSGYEIGSRWINTLTGEEYVCFDASPGSAVWGSTTSGNATWGSDAIFAESLGLSVTTSTKFANKVILNATATASGTYRLGWSYGWNADTTSYDFRAQLLDTDETQLMEHRQEPKDSGGTGWGDFRKTGTDQMARSSGVLYLDLTAGAHTFTLQWCTSGNGNEASIWDATLEFWRHS